MTPRQAHELARVIAYAWPVPAWSPGRVRIYELGLFDLDQRLAAEAVVRLITTRQSRDCPTVGEIRQEALRLAGQLSDLPEPEEAWAGVLRDVRLRGRTGGLSPSTPEAVRQAVQAVGWLTICSSDESALGVHRAAFVAAYRAIRGRVVADRVADGVRADLLCGRQPQRLEAGGAQ